MDVLISLYPGYGLGDAVQMSAVLRHVRKYRPEWRVDYQAEPGRESVGVGLVDRVLCYGDPYRHYDAEVQIILYDTFANWHDRPNTRVTSCLHERFGILWDPDCAGYYVQHTPLPLPGRYVAVHYLGDSAKANKDLTHDQADAICKHILSLGYEPLLLDWRGNCQLPYPSTRTLGFPNEWGRSAERNCAVIASCHAFVGIDSGPGKCASATTTPSVTIWTGHHPAPFHDPSPSTHLVPVNYHGLRPVCNDPGVIAFFEANYNVQHYTDLVQGACQWLTSSLLATR